MIKTPPIICKAVGISKKRIPAKIAATTGSQSFEADTNAGEKYLRHQLKILCPSIVENSAKRRPTITALIPYTNKL